MDSKLKEVITKESALSLYQKALQHKKNKDESINLITELFSNALSMMVAATGDELSPELAPMYYEYADSLLVSFENSGEFIKTNTEDEDEIAIVWELLELSRVIYEKQGGHDLEIANIHIRLGDAKMDDNDWDNSLEEYNKALDIRKKKLAGEDREIAEVLFLMGINRHYKEEYDKAKEYYMDAEKVLVQKFAILYKKIKLKLDNDLNPLDITKYFSITSAQFLDGNINLKEIEDSVKDRNDIKGEVNELLEVKGLITETRQYILDLDNLHKNKDKIKATMGASNGIKEVLKQKMIEELGILESIKKEEKPKEKRKITPVMIDNGKDSKKQRTE